MESQALNYESKFQSRPHSSQIRKRRITQNQAAVDVGYYAQNYNDSNNAVIKTQPSTERQQKPKIKQSELRGSNQIRSKSPGTNILQLARTKFQELKATKLKGKKRQKDLSNQLQRKNLEIKEINNVLGNFQKKIKAEVYQLLPQSPHSPASPKSPHPPPPPTQNSEAILRISRSISSKNFCDKNPLLSKLHNTSTRVITSKNISNLNQKTGATKSTNNLSNLDDQESDQFQSVACSKVTQEQNYNFQAEEDQQQDTKLRLHDKPKKSFDYGSMFKSKPSSLFFSKSRGLSALRYSIIKNQESNEYDFEKNLDIGCCEPPLVQKCNKLMEKIQSQKNSIEFISELKNIKVLQQNIKPSLNQCQESVSFCLYDQLEDE